MVVKSMPFFVNFFVADGKAMGFQTSEGFNDARTCLMMAVMVQIGEIPTKKAANR